MKILNYGSMNLDHVYTVDHPVLPGETIIADTLALYCGGKGLNQSAAVARAGGEVYHAGLVGEDGDLLVDGLRRAGVDVRYVERRPGASCHTMIQVDPRGQNSIVVYNTPSLRFDGEDIDRILSDFASGDAVMLQNEAYNSPLMMRRAADKGLTVIFNPSPMNSQIADYPLDRVDWLLLNEIEGEAISGEKEPERILDVLHDRYPHMNVVLTLGEKGCICMQGDARLAQPAFPVQAVDTTAAGDTFTGYFVTGLSRGLPMPEILRRAALAAAIAVSRPGAADSVPTAEEVDRVEREMI